MGKKLKFVVYVKTVDVFGDVDEHELPCNDGEHQKRLIAQLKHQYKHEPFIKEYIVFGICR